jgi:peptidoglycan DL-endopeptidase CwlO
MTTQDSNTSRGRKTWILGAGLVAIAAIVAYLGFDYPPASDDAAGTIVPANRYRADANSGAPTGDEADQVATSDLGAIQNEATDAADAAASSKAADSAASKSAAVSSKAADSATAKSAAASSKAADSAASKSALNQAADSATAKSAAASSKAADAAAASKAADAAAAQ